MAKQSKSAKLLGEILYRLSVLIGLGCFVAGIKLFDGVVESSQQLLFSAIFAGVGMVGSAMIFLIIKKSITTRRRGVQNFNFEQPATTRHEVATQFEYDVAKLIQQLTGKQTEVVGGSGDGGIDVKVYNKKRKLVGIVQCKRLNPNKAVYPAYIRELNSVRHYHHVNIAYLVTTGRFSDKSYQLAKELGVRLEAV